MVILAAVGLVVSDSQGQRQGAQPGNAAVGNVQAAPVEHQWVTDYLIVRVKPGVAQVRDGKGRWSFALAADATQGMPAKAAKAIKRDAAQAQLNVRSALTNAGVNEIARMGAWAPENIERARRHRLDRYYRVVLAPGSSVAEAQALAAALEAQPALVERAQLDALGTTAGVVPDDPDLDLQWGLLNPFTPGADISAPAAWAITTGAPQMILAVLDSGVSAHTELAGRMVPGINTVDNSGNTADGCNHGTHCAGTAAATADNSVGIAGVNWRTRIMPIRVLTGCSGTEADLADGLQWAADNGAHVANMSLQYSVGTDFLHDGVNYARDAGVVLLAASGNFGTSGGVAFPGRWPETIAVAATNESDGQWSGSNAGLEVTIAAPGANIWSLSSVNNSYLFNSGTSMATAHVSGLACLMRTIDPSLTHDEIQTILIDSADDVLTPGFDQMSGHGRINAQAALQAVLERLGIPGDVNGDELLDESDRSALEALLGVEWGQPGYNPRADLNHDGTIDALDEAILDDLLPPPCFADFVSSQTFQPPGDGVVNAADLAFLLGAWGANPGSSADMVSSATFQPPPDGLVDAADLATLLGWWGSCPEG
jgi:subtilisin family serine protease